MKFLCDLKKWLCEQKQWSIFLSVLTIVAPIIWGAYEFREHVEQQRIQYFIDFGRKYTEDKDIAIVIEYLEYLDHLKRFPKANIKPVDKPSSHQVEMYMRFFEELELMIRSEAVSESGAIYLFGYYTPLIKQDWKSKWPTLKYDQPCWSVYRDFAKRAEKFNYNCKNIEL